MACVDRTFEWKQTLDRVKGQGHGPGGRIALQQDVELVSGRNKAPRSEFSRIASTLGKGLYEVTAKVEKLAKLTKRMSLFNDTAPEIQELTFIIKDDIAYFKEEVEKLKAFTGKNNKNQFSDNVVSVLQQRLTTTAKEFQEVLTTRNDSMKTQQEIEKELTGNYRVVPPPSLRNNFLNIDPSASGDVVAINMPNENQMLLQEDSFLQNRLDAVHQVESSLVALQDMFKQIMQMVQEQGEQIQLIDDNVNNTLVNTSEAQSQLLEYFNTISKNRWFYMKIFGILLVFIVLFFVFFV